MDLIQGGGGALLIIVVAIIYRVSHRDTDDSSD
jgi:hypothetical protein